MSDALAFQPQTNPFATRWTRPGAMPFLFPDSVTADDLVRRLQTYGWQGAIVGPHGSGKSTLLAMLIPAIEALGKRAVMVRLCAGQSRLPLSRRDLQRLGATEVLVVDGYEQLGRFRRWGLSRQWRRNGFGLLITAHGSCNLPVLWRTQPRLELVEQLIERYLPTHEGRISHADIALAWQRHPGDVREIFFELYDQFEARRPIVRITTDLPDKVTHSLAAIVGRVPLTG
jgi:hypothetical protein